MLSGRGWFCSLFAILLVAAFAPVSRGQGIPASATAPIIANGLGKGTVPLDGKWQFHLGDNAAWASPAFDDSNWEQLTADRPWGTQNHHSYTGIAWYRRHIAITLAPGASPDIALFLPYIEDAYEVYWNGVLVGHNGKLPPQPVWYFNPPPQTFGLGTARSGVLSVRVWKAPLGSFDSGDQGGFTSPPVMGSPEAIGASKDAWDYQWLRSRQFIFGLDSLYGLVALLGFLAWLRDRRQWLLFWMAGYSISPLLVDSLERLGIPMQSTTALGLLQPIFGFLSISIWFVLVLLLRLDENRTLIRIVRTLAVLEMVVFSLDGLLIFSLPTLPPKWIPQSLFLDAILTTIFTILQALPLVLVGSALLRWRRLTPERWLVAICAFFADLIPTLRSAVAQGSRYTHWTLADKISAPLFTINGNPINAPVVASTLLLVSVVYAVYRYSLEERRRQSAIEQEFHNARELQQVLIPEVLPCIPGFTVTSAYRPAQEVGGDFFQIIPLTGDSASSTLVVLGDVSGKGLKAAMAVSLIVGMTRMAAEITSSPAEILAALNRRLEGRLNGGFATGIALRLDPDGSCVVSTAGHPAPFLNGHEIELPGALPLGLSPLAVYEERSLRLEEADHLGLYTDGLLEARNPSGELYGFERLQGLFAAKPTAADTTQVAVDFGQDDDITVLTLTRLAIGAESIALHVAPDLTPA